jgi:hypothetical protein
MKPICVTFLFIMLPIGCNRPSGPAPQIHSLNRASNQSGNAQASNTVSLAEARKGFRTKLFLR